MRKFITELRRRNVVKVGTVYVVVAWALMQGADVMFPALNLPPWTVTLVAALVIVGVPVALVLAWAFQLTPTGVARDKTGVDSGAGTEPKPSPQVLAGLTGATPAAASATAVATYNRQHSLAVLPFVDLTPGHDHEYFADGHYALSNPVGERQSGAQDAARTARGHGVALVGRGALTHAPSLPLQRDFPQAHPLSVRCRSQPSSQSAGRRSRSGWRTGSAGTGNWCSAL